MASKTSCFWGVLRNLKARQLCERRHDIFKAKWMTSWCVHQRDCMLNAVHKNIRSDRGLALNGVAAKAMACIERNELNQAWKILGSLKPFVNRPPPGIKRADGTRPDTPAAVRETWLEYFASTQGGSSTSFQDLVQSVRAEHAVKLQNGPVGTWTPTRYQVEAIMSRAKCGKQVGEDRIASDVYRDFSVSLAWSLTPHPVQMRSIRS